MWGRDGRNCGIGGNRASCIACIIIGWCTVNEYIVKVQCCSRNFYRYTYLHSSSLDSGQYVIYHQYHVTVYSSINEPVCNVLIRLQ